MVLGEGVRSASRVDAPVGRCVMHANSSEAERVFVAYLASLTPGEPFDLDQLVARHPELADALRSLHDDWRRLSELVDATQGAPAANASIRARFGDEANPAVTIGRGQDEDPSVDPLLRGLEERRPATSRYQLLGEVARGGMGVILKVWDSDLRRHLAMKVILDKTVPTTRSEASVVARFLEEAQITGQLDHPSIVPVHELGLAVDGRVYFTMRLVRGRDLAKVFEDAWSGVDGWNTTRALGSLLRACEAVAFAHAKGVVHRDLKPANVMVGRFGEVYVMDWGLARVLGQPDRHDLRLDVDPSRASVIATDRSDPAASDSPLRTADGDIIGTPTYMAPEQALGRLAELNQAADVYSIGAMLYHLLARTPPYVQRDEKTTANIVLSRLFVGSPEPLSKLAPDVAPELISICEKAMARKPADRYANMEELSDDLRAYLEDRVVRAHRTGAIVELRKWMKRNRVASAAILVAIALAVGGSSGIAIVQARANERIGLLGQDIETRQAELEAASSKLNDTRNQLLSEQQEVVRLEQRRRETDSELRATRERMEASSAEALRFISEIEHHRRTRDEIATSLREMKDEREALRRQIDVLDRDRAEIMKTRSQPESDGN